jgi:hypothetical protein
MLTNIFCSAREATCCCHVGKYFPLCGRGIWRQSNWYLRWMIWCYSDSVSTLIFCLHTNWTHWKTVVILF